MIEREAFRKTEGMLYRYYRDKRKVNRLKNKIEILEYKKESMLNNLKNLNITLSSDIQAITYDKPYVQSNSDGTSQVERELYRQIEKIRENIISTTRQILKLQTVVSDIESRNADIEYVIKLMSEESKRFIELKYGEEVSIYTIANKLPMSKSTADRRRQEIVEDISKYFSFRGTKVGQTWD